MICSEINWSSLQYSVFLYLKTQASLEKERQRAKSCPFQLWILELDN